MNIFNVITLFGGLAMFLYGMRLMGDSLKESSSAALKKAMESVTNSTVKAFFLGLLVTAVIQSSTATIVITSGLVAAGIITLRQSLGIIVGANVGTTVTGQIIRLLDLNSGGTSWLQLFKPSTLAPVALIIGIVLIMFCNFRNSKSIGSIAMGFGILFSGLLNMTGAVSSLSDSGTFDALFSGLGSNPFLGYLTGAGVAFILQSSSATIGILQAFAATGLLSFKAIYAVIVGIYLGDCLTTAIVCSIGAKPNAKRVGIVNILFNLSETVLVLVVVAVVHKLGLLNSIWDETISSGGIANTNTVFNLGCAVVLFPLLGVYEKLSYKIVKDTDEPVSKYAEKMEGLNPAFIATPAIALNSCYNVLIAMFESARDSLRKAVNMLGGFDEDTFSEISSEEDSVDMMADGVSKYLTQLAPGIKSELHVGIMDQYYKDVTEFERLSDHALNIAELARDMKDGDISFSEMARKELDVINTIMDRIFDNAEVAFKKCDTDAARHIEPLEQVIDDIVAELKSNHIERLRRGECTVDGGTVFLNLLSEIERISDVCSNIGIATLTRVFPETASLPHNYISELYSTTKFVDEYNADRAEFFGMLES